MTALAPARVTRPAAHRVAANPARGLGWVLTSEGLSSLVGFGALVVLARRLGPGGFGNVEYAAGVSAWLLVLVRGGFDVVVSREAARRPRLVGRLTDLLIGLRCLAAAVALGVAGLVALAVGPERGRLVLAGALALIVSAATADVGLRASCRFRALGVFQGLRALGYAAAVLAWVRGPGDELRAALAVLAAEILGAVGPLALHAREWGWPRPRFRRRATRVLARRGLVAGLTRFGRVSLYAADLLALGACDGPELGPYAASRRLVYALLGLGLVVPTALGPALARARARAWQAGSAAARDAFSGAVENLGAVAAPAALGLALTADRLLPALFGPSYEEAGPWLALLAARLPWLLAAGCAQAALLACRREDEALRLVTRSATVSLLLIPAGLAWGGPWGVGWGALAAEGLSAAFGFVSLRGLGLTRPVGRAAVRVGLACLGMATACRLTGGLPLVVTCLAGAAAYGALWQALAGGRRGNSWPTP